MSKSEDVTFVLCGPQTATCACACPDGPCEHDFSAERTFTMERDGCRGGTTVCVRCGMDAMAHDLWVMP